jgi:hypothetical protein
VYPVNNPDAPTQTAQLVVKPVTQAFVATNVGVFIEVVPHIDAPRTKVVPQIVALLIKFVAVTQFVAFTIGVFTEVVPHTNGEVTQVPALEIPVAHKLFE